MYGRVGLERFKKAESLEPFSVSSDSSRKASSPVKTEPPSLPSRIKRVSSSSGEDPSAAPAQPPPQVTQRGAGRSGWVPPDWAVEPLSGLYYLEVMKDGEILGTINLEKRRHIFGRQVPMCDFVLDHQSISRQHAAVVPHKNGRSVSTTTDSGSSDSG